MFDWIGEAVQAVTFAYLVRNFPGILLMLAGAVLTVVIAWKHNQKASDWKFNPRQMFDMALLLLNVYCWGMGTYLTVWWEG